MTEYNRQASTHNIHRLLEREKSTKHITTFLDNEFNLSVRRTQLAEGILGIYTDERSSGPLQSQFTYHLLVDKYAQSTERNYVSILSSAGIVLGNLREDHHVVLPTPEAIALKKLDLKQRNQFFHTLMLTQELLEGIDPKDWDPDIHELLERHGSQWKQAAMRRGEKIVNLLHTQPIAQTIPELEDRLDTDIRVFSGSYL